MKATGIVRRIDDLGRIVIPKEIRKTLRIRETDPLEIFTNGQGEIILKKYSAVNELGEFAKCYADSVATATGQVVCVTDRESVIAVSGGDKKSIRTVGGVCRRTKNIGCNQGTEGICKDYGRGGRGLLSPDNQSNYMRGRYMRFGNYAL